MLKQIIRDFKNQIEAGLIGAVIVCLLINIFFFPNNTAMESLMNKLSMSAIVLLCILYILISDKQLLFIACLVMFAVSLIYTLTLSEVSKIADYLSTGSFVLSAITIGLLCVKHSREFKNFETMEGILALFLIITATRYSVETDYSQYYSFGICFLIATLMYNNNLWERYKPSERNLLILLLVYFFAEVIKVSGNYISI